MHLSGHDGTEFHLSIVGYEFPELTEQWGDADWLMIKMRVQHRLGDWTSTAPMLLTWEAGDLADWLSAVADGRAERPSEGFMEPNLRFAVTSQGATDFTMQVFFEQESRPPWDPSRFGFTDHDVASIELHPTADALRHAAADLRRQLEQFPVRVGRHHKASPGDP